MNKIERMLQELCSNGVEYFLFGEVCEYVRGITYNKSQEVKSANENAWRVFRANNITLSSNTLNYEDIKLVSKNVKVKETQILRHGDILICAGSGSKEHIGKVAYIPENMDYTFGGFMAVIRCSKNLNSRFLFHILASEMFSDYLSSALNSSTINNLNAGIIKDFSIPVPPLPIQEEIVRILDHFTELTAELQARQEQYEYYRNKLLTFDEESVTWMKMSEIGEICMCKRIMKHQTNSNSGIPFYKIGTFGKKADAYISNELYEEYKKNYSFPRKGEILISASGTIGRTIIYDGKPAYFQDSNIIWISNDERKVLNKFLYYCYQIAEWKTEGGTIKRLYNVNLAKMKIAVPPLSDQQRIVAILDKFETLVNDLTQGLPAEIAAVQEQYEYYRNKLLTFKRIA